MRKIVSYILAICIIIVCLTSFCSCSKATLNEFYGKWLEYIKDETLLTDVVIPGSHDAGSNGMLWLAETQSTDIDIQLAGGVRYFDIRVEKKSNGKLVIFHGPIRGQAFSDVLTDIVEFMKISPTETLILDFQHFNGGSENDVASLIETSFADILLVNSTSMTDLDYVDSLTLGECRGKILITWGSDTCADKAWAFRRNNDECTLENTVLQSKYDGDLHKQGSEYFIENALSAYISDYIAKDKGLFVLQGQLTAPKLLNSPKGQERKHDNNMTNYILSLKDNLQVLPYINIIMRDYIITDKMEKVNSILNLNISKNNVKTDNVELFTQETKIQA